jgi:MtrB/PioB family decaheme-associated outer membrane protein
MKTQNEKLQVSVSVLAVRGALVAMFAMPLAVCAADNSADGGASLKSPSNSIEVGVGNVSRDSAGFGEYNGLEKSGAKLIGNLDMKGGEAYNGSGVRRWELKGNDLGTTSRSLSGSVGDQGKWNLGVGYDELRHNISDTYQTPLQGSMGGNAFTLPSSFGTVNAQSNPSTRVLNSTQLGAFHTEKIATTRKNTSFNAGYVFSPELSLDFDFKRLNQSGAKLFAIAALGAPATTGTWRAEALSIVPNPTNYRTDTFDVALNWAGDKGHLTGAYYVSIFSNAYDSVSAQNPMVSNASTATAGLYQTNTMSTSPDNSLHQVNLSGGYAFSSDTKLVGTASYGRNTQNNAFLTGLPEISLSPNASLNGLVLTKHTDLKLTHLSSQDLTLSAGLKYNERNNRSQSSIYNYYAINNTAAVDRASNAPYSNRKTQVELAADYRIRKGQSVRLAYEHEATKRWCDSYAVTAGNCLINPTSKENKLGVTFKQKAGDELNFNLGYSYGKRNSAVDITAITPLGGLDAASLTDTNSQNFVGFVAFPNATRTQQQVKAGVNWRPGEKLDVGLNGRYSKDKYAATLGVQDGSTVALNLDSTYRYIENGTITAYATQERRSRDMTDQQNAAATNASATAINVPANSTWTNKLKDQDLTVGVGVKQANLMAGKLEVAGDLTYSLGRTGFNTKQNYAGLTTGGLSCSSPNILTCGDTPDITSKLVTFKLTGNYQLDKSAQIAVGYVFKQVKAIDYFYNGEQYGFTPNRVMPTNAQAPNYTINVVNVSYRYMF